MVTRQKFLLTMDQLLVERGEYRDKMYRLTVTTGELLKLLDLKPSTPHHRHVKGLVEMHYRGTIAEPIGAGDGANGFNLHIKIRSK